MYVPDGIVLVLKAYIKSGENIALELKWNKILRHGKDNKLIH